MTNKNGKYLVVKAKGGMGNRMLCAITGILYGQLTNRKTIVDWSDESYSNNGSNTFARFFNAPQVFTETSLPEDGSIRPKIWRSNLSKSMSRMLHEYDPDKHRSITIHRKYSIDVRRLDYDEDVVIFWYYTGRIKILKRHLHNPDLGLAGLNHAQIIRKVLHEQMQLQDNIRQRIREYKAVNWPDNVIGIHIRYTDRKASLEKYEKHLCRFLKMYPDAHIFLATDNQQVNKEYHKRFKNVFSAPKWFPNGTNSMHQNEACPDKVANGIEALIDMYLLSDCNCLIYSGCSTFSLISRILSNARSENIVDIDRFNAKVKLKKLIRDLVI